MTKLAVIKSLFTRSRMLPVATAVLLLPLVWSGAASAVTRSCSAEYRIFPTNFRGVAVNRTFRAEAQAVGPNTARRHAYEKIFSCVNQHWTSSSADWPVSCRPAAGVLDYPFRRLEVDIPAAVCAANPGHSRITVEVEVHVTGDTGCGNPHGENDWGITQISPSYPVSCGDVIPHSTNTDRPGQDYRNFTLSTPPRPGRRPSTSDWHACYEACVADTRCQAWTYVRPGVQGSQARCWLKNGVPAAHSDSCCISGVIGRGLR